MYPLSLRPDWTGGSRPHRDHDRRRRPGGQRVQPAAGKGELKPKPVPVSRFGAPKGLGGWLAAQLVARLTAGANRWMIDCLEVGAGDRVLDVGCGPGLAVAYAAASDSRAVGVDASPTMVRHAGRRNRAAIRQGRVEIRRADATRLPFADGAFTKVGSLNSLQFWPAPEQGLAELHRVLEPGGRVAVVLMARSDEPAEVPTPPWVEQLLARMGTAGFASLTVATRPFGGVLHRALLGYRPGKESGAPLDPTADGVRKGAGP